MSGLVGRGAVVTGGGRGIGRAVAEALAGAGASVVLAARSAGELEDAAAAVRGAGGEAHAVPCDVTDAGSVDRLAARATELLGQVDILVNNAGAAEAQPLQRLTLERWQAALAVNATGPFLCTRALLPAMVERRRGRIVTVASIAGLTGAPYIAAYAAAKHAAVGFVRAVAAEVAASGVTVNAVCPGYVDTDMTRESVARIVEKTRLSEQEALDRLVAANPQGRLIEVDEVAHVVLALCGDGARGINGQAIAIDGGARGT